MVLPKEVFLCLQFVIKSTITNKVDLNLLYFMSFVCFDIEKGIFY